MFEHCDKSEHTLGCLALRGDIQVLLSSQDGRLKDLAPILRGTRLSVTGRVAHERFQSVEFRYSSVTIIEPSPFEAHHKQLQGRWNERGGRSFLEIRGKTLTDHGQITEEKHFDIGDTCDGRRDEGIVFIDFQNTSLCWTVHDLTPDFLVIEFNGQK